ncbi:MAG: YfhO family protein [Clostridia bacterium]|nr:YfhO family protein [Clostridia bacterium]
MVYSYKKAMTLRPQKEKGLSTFLIALATATVIFLPFIIKDSGYFLFYGDFNVQQIPFYQLCHDAVRNGNFGWNQYTDLGVNFIGSYSFYLLGSPFFWLTIPFPNWMLPYLMGPLLILKFACAALTAYLFIRRFTRTPEAARLGGILYAFCGFSIYNVFFNHFHEAIIVFPLLLLSLELFITENRRGIFAFCVFLSATVNYFFFYGMVVFVIIYFIIRLWSKAIKITFGRFLLLAFEAVLGLLMSAAILLPTVICVLGVDRTSEFLTGWNAIMYGKEQIYLNIIECFFFPPDLPARPVFFPDANVKWSSLGGWLPVFGMVGVFAYCGAKKGNWLKRIICTSFVFAMFPILNSAFSFFNTAYYARWFYMPILMMALATVMALEDREVQWKSAFRWVGFITLAFTLVIGLFPQETLEGEYAFGIFNNNTSSTFVARFWITCAIAVVSFLIALALIKAFRRKDRSFFNVALCFVCVVSVIYGVIFIGNGKQHSYEVQSVMIDSLIEGELELEGDKDRLRVDAYDCVDNTGMYLGYSSINAFHSIVPTGVVDFYEYVGEERSVASRPTTENYALRNLLSVRYVLNLNNEDPFEPSVGETLMPGYTFKGAESGHKIYENNNYVPLGFTYDNYMTKEYCDTHGESLRANLMLKAVLLNNDQIEKYSDRLTELEKDLYYNFDEQELADDCAALNANSADSFKYTKTGFTSVITCEKDTLAFFSIPYEAGWTATVNGKKVDVEQVNVGFMAVPVDAGENKIVFTYETPGLYMGINITIASTAVFVIYLIICLATKRRRNERTELVYPEGDELVEKWLAYDIADAVEDNQIEEEITTLDSIAESLNNAYPVGENNFDNGFRININSEDDLDK